MTQDFWGREKVIKKGKEKTIFVRLSMDVGVKKKCRAKFLVMGGTMRR